MEERVKDIREGEELSPVAGEISLEKMRLYEMWPERKNIHNDFGLARKSGLPKPVCRGVMFSSFIFQMLSKVFGEFFFQNNKVSLNFLKPLFPGDKVLAKGKVIQKKEVSSGMSYSMDIWIEKEKGEIVAAGNAIINVPGIKGNEGNLGDK
jgi:acyl dehydratase